MRAQAQYNVVVGMEVHAQLLTKTKMFCRCSADYQGAPPNTHTCPVCLGLPGALPVSNRAAVEATIRTGLALNCDIAQTAVFARKNYHYPDLPKGYQISQYELPLCRNGWVEIDLPDSRRPKRIRIHRAHLEEDTGKNTHAGLHTLVDLNRAGMPLLEIVTEADIASAEEAYAFLTKLRSILRYLGVNSGAMEEGALRCEPNISVRTPEQAARGELGTKVEVKNLNSLRAVRSAIHHALVTTRLDSVALVADNHELSRIVRVGSEDYGRLDQDERHRFGLVMYYSFSAGENFYYQYRQGALDQEQWERWCETLRVYFAQPGIREWFETTPQQFTASFSAFLDAEFKRSHVG